MALILHSQLLSMAAFVHTVETGSFTAAAARMGVSKSATGKHVARLEQRLGVKLLNRTTRSISLTEEGELYYRSCLRVMDELDETESLLASRKKWFQVRCASVSPSHMAGFVSCLSCHAVF